MVKRGGALLLSIVMIISVFPVIVFATEFSDMPNNWSTLALKNAVANGLLNGNNGKIRPDDNLTRAEMATIVNRAFGAKEKALISQYTDVSENAWYYDEMAKAVQMGTFMGNGNRLNPDNSITREEVFVVLARAFKLSSVSEDSLNTFLDKTEISAWAKDGVASLVSVGYITGSNDKLNPKKNITRAEFAQVMDNLVKTYVNKEGTYTTVNDGNVMVNVPNIALKDLTINGDLIIGDGIRDGDLTLENVKVIGRTVIRGGGGENSIRIIGNSNIQNIIIARVNGVVRVYGEEGTNVGEVIVNGSDDVIVEGSVGTVTVAATDVVVSTNNATIKNINIFASNSGLIVSKDSNVDIIILDAEKSNVEVLGEVKSINITEKAEKSSINVAKGGKVEEVQVNAKETTVNGKGSVKSVEVKADNVEVNTPNTKVIAAKGTTGVKANGRDIRLGISTDDTEEKKGGSSVGGGGGRSDDDNDDDNNNVKADLTAYYKALAAVEEADYTSDSWAVYKKVVEANVVTVENSQAEVDAATAAIVAAQANLVKKEEKPEPVLATIDVIQANVVLGYDKIKVTLNVDNPEDYKVGSSALSEFVYNHEDGTFTGVAKSGTTAEELVITEKEVEIKATIVSIAQFLPGVYDVHVTLNVDNPEDYTVYCDGKEFKSEDGVFKGPSYTNAITVEDLVIVKK